MSGFFTFPANYQSGAQSYESDNGWARGNPAPEISDGRQDTFKDGDYFRIDFSSTTAITHLFLRSSGVTNVTLSDASTIALNRTSVPTRLSGHPLEVDGVNNAHFPLSITTNQIRLHFEGTNQRIYNVALCSVGINVGPSGVWQEIRNRRVDRTSVKRTNIRGDFVTTRGRGDRWKWVTEYTGIFSGNPTQNNRSNIAEGMMRFLENNPNFFYWPNQTDYPYLFYPATLEDSAFEINYVGRQYYQQQISLTIAEM